MNTKTKRRMIVVTGVIIMVLIVVLAVVGGSSSAKPATISDLATGEYVDQKIQVSGNVVENSYTTEGDVLTFDIYDPNGDASQQLRVRFEGGVSATFGNNVTAICTGKMGQDGVLNCSELVTKCPSKYENATDALSVGQLLGYGDGIVGNTVKVSGVVKDGTLKAAGEGDRLVIVDAGNAADQLAVLFDGALSEDIADGSSLVLTGSMDEQGKFAANDVALEG